MNDLTLLRDFRAERDDGDPRARAAARDKLEAAFESTGDAATSRARAPRRGLLALAGAGALVAAVGAVLVLGSSSSTEPAAAEVLHQTAAVAASSDAPPELLPGPGQFLYKRTKRVELTGWYPGSYEVPEGQATRPGGFSALVPFESEWWSSPQGGGRSRETIGDLHFLSGAEQSRWEAAGSPLPSNFEPTRQEELRRVSGGLEERFLETRPGVIDIEYPQSGAQASPELAYPDLSGVPTDPEELRLAVQNHQVSGVVPGISGEPGKPLSTEETIEDLEGFLVYPNASAALRAAAFNALAEMPGVDLDRGATDLVGRPGYAIGYDRGRGLRDEFIVDPATSKLLGERTVLVEPAQDPVAWKGYEAGLTIRDVAYLQSAVVDSTREQPEGG